MKLLPIQFWTTLKKEDFGELEEGIKTNVMANKACHSRKGLKNCVNLVLEPTSRPKNLVLAKPTLILLCKALFIMKHKTLIHAPKQNLHTIGRWYNKKLDNVRLSYKIKHYKIKVCRGCPLRIKYSTNKLGRVIERTEYQEHTNRNNDKVNINSEYYNQRQQISRTLVLNSQKTIVC